MVNRNIEEVSRSESSVTLKVLGVELVFTKKPGRGIRLVSKIKEAQVYDPSACRVPKVLFLAAYWEARDILNPAQKGGEKTPKLRQWNKGLVCLHCGTPNPDGGDKCGNCEENPSKILTREAIFKELNLDRWH